MELISTRALVTLLCIEAETPPLKKRKLASVAGSTRSTKSRQGATPPPPEPSIAAEAEGKASRAQGKDKTKSKKGKFAKTLYRAKKDETEQKKRPRRKDERLSWEEACKEFKAMPVSVSEPCDLVRMQQIFADYYFYKLGAYQVNNF